MRLPNGYGSVIKMAGKRRKPFAVRTSSIVEYICICALGDISEASLLKKNKFRYSNGEWTAVSTEKSRDFASSLGYPSEYKYKQAYTYHKFFEKRDEAIKYLANLNGGIEVKEHAKQEYSLTFKEMYGKWKEYRRGLKRQIALRTWEIYDIYFEYFKILHNRPIATIRPAELQEILNANNNLSRGSISAMRSVLKGTFGYATANKYIETDITAHLIYEWSETGEEIHKPFTEDEVKTLWDNIDRLPDVDLVLIYIYTGARPSELLKIPRGDINIEEQYMTGGLKTRAGKNRIIPISDKILPMVVQRCKYNGDFPLTPKYGKSCSYITYKNHFAKLMERLGFDHIPHDTRHTFASFMDTAGANSTCIKLIMGHSFRNDVTKGVYTHKTPKELLEEVNKM